MVKVSVIIPVYNAGQYLDKCISTLVKQTLQDIEFIFILDCPTDGSDVVVQKYADTDNRIKVIRNQSNLHIGNSRNVGLDVAQGEYIGFSDHDDFRKLEMYEELYLYAKRNNHDIVMSLTCEVNKEGTENRWNVPIVNVEYFKEYCLSNMIGGGNLENNTSWFCNVHSCIYKKDLLDKYQVRFVDTCLLSPEDLIFNIEAVYNARNVGFISKVFYYHRIGICSAGRSTDYVGWKKRSAAAQYIFDFLVSNKIFPLYEMNFYMYVSRQYLKGLLAPLLHHDIFDFISGLRYVRTQSFTHKAFLSYIEAPNNRPWYKNTFRKLIVWLIVVQS
ncbi:MAG: glycosyltransferase family 2 protein [bacterium]|uniref:Glycosyltransferase family 2 protein n=1 Tax=Candidatus Aphodosoma intestinipullorum TaxID=2840674 RepID=A0A940DL11_9BACT|nr:glycosyltransferase family 2 protein [Candidatus Aphodosoma intestinipullorum]